MTTEIEELKDAAKSIQSLQRVLAYPSQVSSDRGGNRRLPLVDHAEPESSVFSDVDEPSLTTDTTEGRRSGISTRLGHPRGVMQFIPSIRNDQFVPNSEIRRNSVSRKSSVPDGFMSSEISSEPVPNVRARLALNCFSDGHSLSDVVESWTKCSRLQHLSWSTDLQKPSLV